MVVLDIGIPEARFLDHSVVRSTVVANPVLSSLFGLSLAIEFFLVL